MVSVFQFDSSRQENGDTNGGYDKKENEYVEGLLIKDIGERRQAFGQLSYDMVFVGVFRQHLGNVEELICKYTEQNI